MTPDPFLAGRRLTAASTRSDFRVRRSGLLPPPAGRGSRPASCGPRASSHLPGPRPHRGPQAPLKRSDVVGAERRRLDGSRPSAPACLGRRVAEGREAMAGAARRRARAPCAAPSGIVATRPGRLSPLCCHHWLSCACQLLGGETVDSVNLAVAARAPSSLPAAGLAVTPPPCLSQDRTRRARRTALLVSSTRASCAAGR
jgi:hypothetical protein